MKLYDKYFYNHSSSIDRDQINNLNNHRNSFIHFNTDTLLIEKELIISSCNEAIQAMLYIIKNKKGLLGASEQSIHNLLLTKHS